MPHTQPYNLDRTVRLVINCVIFLGVIWLVNTLRGVLLPFCVGCLIAYIFEPFVQFNRELLKLKGRVIATLVTLFEVFFFFAVFCYIFIPMIVHESAQMASMLKAYATSQHSVPFVPESIHYFLRRHLDFEMLASKLSRDEWISMIEDGL